MNDFNPDRVDPLPAGVDIDLDRFPSLLGDEMLRVCDPDDRESVADALMSGRWTWSLAGWDEIGHATFEVIERESGELVGTGRIHWSLLGVLA